MNITETETGIKKGARISAVEEKERRLLTRKRFAFNWKMFGSSDKLFKLQIEDNEDILGVMNYIEMSDEKRIEIKLLACASENVGASKKYDGITGCLIAFACRSAKAAYGDLACVSLVPKTVLREHYINKYHMLDGGWQLYLEGAQMISLINEYLL